MKANLITLVCLAGLTLTGCNASHYETPDVKASNRRFLWDTTGFEVTQTKTMDLRNTNVVSVTTTVRLQKSNPNAEAIKAVAEGISEGVIKGAGKAIVPVP